MKPRAMQAHGTDLISVFLLVHSGKHSASLFLHLSCTLRLSGLNFSRVYSQKGKGNSVNSLTFVTTSTRINSVLRLYTLFLLRLTTAVDAESTNRLQVNNEIVPLVVA